MGPRVDELAAASVDGAIRYPAADPVDGRRKISEHKTCPASQNTFTYSCPTDTCSTFADSHCAHDISSTHTTRPAVVTVPYALTARKNDDASELEVLRRGFLHGAVIGTAKKPLISGYVTRAEECLTLAWCPMP